VRAGRAATPSSRGRYLGECQGSRAAVQPVPRSRHVVGSRDALDGRGHGIGSTFGLALAKSQVAVGNGLPSKGTVLFSLADRDKSAGLEAARAFAELGLELAAT